MITRNAFRGNKVSNICETQLKNGYLILTASEMSFLISYFGILIGDLIPDDDPVWDFFLTLFEIIDLINSSVISEDDIAHLKSLIKSHNEQYQELFNEKLKPKHHIITHYPRVIKTLGPVKYLAGQKFEAFHKRSKQFSSLVTSRVNIIFTLALKLQLDLCFRILSKKGLQDVIEFGCTIQTVKIKNTTIAKLKNCYICEVSYIKINGKIYKKNYAIFLGVNENIDPCFGIIQNIFKDDSSNAFFVYKMCYTIGLNNSIKCYEIILPSKNSVDKNSEININEYIRPLKVHRTACGKRVISRRDLE